MTENNSRTNIVVPSSGRTNVCAATTASIVSSLDNDIDDDDSLVQAASDFVLNVEESQESKSSATRALLLFHNNNVALSGRSTELQTLRDCYKRISSCSSETVLIKGTSGTGKSKLAGALRESVALHGNGFFVSGKFDDSVRTASREPYSALVEAFTDLCDLVSQQRQFDEDGENYCERIAVALKDELSVLRRVIPNLSTITGGGGGESDPILNDDDDDDVNTIQRTNGKDCFTRLKLSCRKFLNAIACPEHPVVLHLDDLQWADQASIQVLQSLVTDTKESKYVLIIGTQRTGDDDDDTTLNSDNILQPSTAAEMTLPCTTIQLDTFSLHQVNTLISTMLGNMPLSDTLELAELVLKRTDGLPIFVVKFMELLKDRQLLVHRSTCVEWHWSSVAEIQAQTTASDNVVNVITARIEQQTPQSQAILRLASIQGFRFDPSVLTAVLGKKDGSTKAKNEERVLKALKEAVRDGLVEKNQHDGTFQFCHDRIHESLYFAIPDDELAGLHLSVARVLQGQQQSNAANKERHVFSIADHFNQASQLLITEKEKYDCAECNLRATNLAMRKSAYSLAADYATSGLAQIDANCCWNDYYYHLTLDLHCKAAESYYSCGDIERCNDYLDDVFQNARTINDSCGAYFIKVRSLGAQARLSEAIDVAFTAVRALGVKLPKRMNMANAIWQIVKTKAMLGGKTDEQLLAVPSDGDENSANMFQAIRLLGMATNYASWAMKIPHLCISIVTMLQMSMRGLASDSAVFASYGILAAVMKDIPEAVRMGQLALRYEGNQVGMHISLGIAHTFLLHWRIPFYESLAPVVQSYNTSMDAGDFDAAFMATETYILMAFYCGRQLVDLEEQMRAYCTQMFEFDNMSHIYISLPYWQLFLNLLGQNDVPTILTGEAMNQKKLEQDSQKVSVVPQTMTILRIFLCFHFEDILSLKSLLIEHEGYEKRDIGHFVSYISQFYIGMSYIALYRKLDKRSYKQKVLKIVKQMRKWTKDGCINTKPLLSLLEAEMLTLTKTAAPQNVKTAFDQAIHDASEFHNTGLTALANERAAHYFLSLDDSTTSTEAPVVYMKRALDMYAHWGAMAKITHLEYKYGGLLGIPQSGEESLPVEIVASKASIS